MITTAQVFGRKPPLLVTRDMVRGMQPGSVIVDMAAETGGNVEGSVAGEVVERDGVTIIGSGNWSGQVCRDASKMYSTNLFNLIDEYWDRTAAIPSIWRTRSSRLPDHPCRGRSSIATIKQQYA